MRTDAMEDGGGATGLDLPPAGKGAQLQAAQAEAHRALASAPPVRAMDTLPADSRFLRGISLHKLQEMAGRDECFGEHGEKRSRIGLDHRHNRQRVRLGHDRCQWRPALCRVCACFCICEAHLSSRPCAAIFSSLQFCFHPDELM